MPPLDEDLASEDALQRLHGLLVEAVRRRRGIDPYQVPVTVAEIYQELVPYRLVRSALGFEMNADYEHALLRLLAGEAELARIEPGTARDQLARELQSPNPNVALYRKYAACDVWLLRSATPPTPDWVAQHLEDDGDPEFTGLADADSPELELALEEHTTPTDFREQEEEVEMTPPTPPDDAPAPAYGARTFTVAEDVDDVAPAAPAATPVRREADAPAAAQQGRCAFCDSALPKGRSARFCPYCGADQMQRPCVSCGEAVEAGWAFCIACGAPADGVSA